MITIYDFIEDIANSIGVHYDFGSYKSIQKKLIEQSINGVPIASMYPLMFLVTQDMTEKSEVDDAYNSEYPLHIVIVNVTKPTYSNRERLEYNFKPVLYPIYDKLIGELRRYSIDPMGRLPRSKKDYFFYSTEDNKPANKLSEFLDAIELTDFSLLRNFKENECNL